METMLGKTEQELMESYEKAKGAVLEYISMVMIDALRTEDRHSLIMGVAVLYELAGNILGSVNRAASCMSDAAIKLDAKEGH